MKKTLIFMLVAATLMFPTSAMCQTKMLQRQPPVYFVEGLHWTGKIGELSGVPTPPKSDYTIFFDKEKSRFSIVTNRKPVGFTTYLYGARGSLINVRSDEPAEGEVVHMNIPKGIQEPLILVVETVHGCYYMDMRE